MNYDFEEEADDICPDCLDSGAYFNGFKMNYCHCKEGQKLKKTKEDNAGNNKDEIPAKNRPESF